MQLQTFRHLWGVQQPFGPVFPAIKEAGYAGIEYKSVHVAGDPGFLQLLKAFDFLFIAQIHTQGETVGEQVASFKQLTQTALALNPVKIVSQSGKDSWNMEQKNEFIVRALAYEHQVGIPVAHETHRGRIFYNPWDTREFIKAHKNLKLCCDFSHWVCVCERLINTELDVIELCAERCIHLHCRVGYEQGPQVSDPRAPEQKACLEAHEQWWQIIWQKQRNNAVAVTTLAPEFGPPGYQQILPFTQQPVSDLWDICNWMNNRQKQRFYQL